MALLKDVQQHAAMEADEPLVTDEHSELQHVDVTARPRQASGVDRWQADELPILLLGHEIRIAVEADGDIRNIHNKHHKHIITKNS